MEPNSYSFIDFFIMLVLASIMFGLGLSLTGSSFRNLLRFPRSLISGLAAQMIALPLIAYLILLFSEIPAEYKVGIMILAACPGGTTSGFVTYLFKGNVALSISLTAVNSMLTLFTIPFIVNLSLQHYMGMQADLHLPVLTSILQIFFVTLLPAFLGVVVRRWKPVFAGRLEDKIKYILILLLAIVYAIKFFAGKSAGGTGLLLSEFWVILPFTLIFNVICFLFGIFFGKLTRLIVRDAFTVAIEVSLHNTTLAILIGGTLLHNQELVKPALIYSIFSFWTALIFGYLSRRFFREKLSQGLDIPE